MLCTNNFIIYTSHSQNIIKYTWVEISIWVGERMVENKRPSDVSLYLWMLEINTVYTHPSVCCLATDPITMPSATNGPVSVRIW